MEKLLYIQRVLYVYVYRVLLSRIRLIRLRHLVTKWANSEEKEYIDEAIGDLSDAGWVLTSRSLNKAAFTRFERYNTGDGLTLLVEVIDDELVLSGTGAEDAEAELKRLRWNKSLPTGESPR